MKKHFVIALCTIAMMVWAMNASAQEKSEGADSKSPTAVWPAVVRTQCHNLITPQHTVKRVPQDYTMPAQVYGLLAYSKKWPNGNGAGNYGVYTFTADKPNTMKAVVKGDAFAASGGAIYAPGRLHVLNFESLWGTIILNYDYYHYSTQYWDELEHVHADDVTRLMSATGVYDATTGSYYAAMYNESMDRQVFGTLDYSTNSRKVIRELPENENIAAMAVNADGIVYAIRFDGKLATINKQTGRMTVIGTTGITPKYLQSAAIDPRTGRLFWAACSDEDPVGLYEVDIETGEAALIEEFKNSEEFVGLYIPMPPAAEQATAAPTALSATFKTDSLQGTVNFRLPTKTYSGEELDGTLTYSVYIDGEKVAEGTDAPGASVKPVVSVSRSAMYRIEVSATNEAGESPKVHLDKYIGKDQPTAPTGVKLTRNADSGELKLTWAAPTSTGVHKGYVNRDSLNYTVVRMPDSVTVAEKATERTFTETIVTDALASYYYVVTAFNGDIRGLSAESNRIVLGTVVEVPYFEDFEDLTVVPTLWTFIDANGDKNTWRSGFWNGTQNADIYYQYNEDGKTPADDWAITPPIHLAKGRFYTLSFDLNGYFIGTEKMSAWMGTDKTVAAMQTLLLPTTVVDYTDQRSFSSLVKSDADGRYYFGFHAESDADQAILELDNIRIEEAGSFEAPDTVSDFIVTPGKNGARVADIAFRAPTTDFYGNAIGQIDKIEVYRDDKLVKTFEAPAPGQDISFRETSLPNGQMVTWSVYTYNSFGCGIPAVCSAWIGVDIPTEPTDLKLVMNGTTAKLTWKAPTTGVHGGFINPSQLTYNIEDMNFYIKGDHRAGTTFTENRGTKQDFLYYRVSAQSAAGGGNYAYSNTVICGSPYALPFFESFAGAQTDHLWSQQVSGGQIGLTQSLSADGDQGAALFKPEKSGDVGMLTTGKINISKAAHPIVEFYYYAIPKQTTSLTLAVAPEGDSDSLAALHTIDYSTLGGEQGWRKATVSLDAYVNTSYVLLAFVGRAEGSRHGDIIFDAITVREQDNTDLVLQQLDVPSTVEAGTKARATVTVLNNGRLKAGTYRVQITMNGRLVEERKAGNLASGDAATLTFDIPTTVADNEENTITATVIADGDANPDNDAATATLLLQAPLYPAPTALAGYEKDGEMVLSWQAPDLTPRDILVSDDFEHYQPFVIDDMGRWTVRDGDGRQTGSIVVGDGQTVMYDHVGEPMAWQVFNADKAGLADVSVLAPYSGSQMLINMVELNGVTADDWLISPRLSGLEQTVSFWVKSVNASAIETFTVMASQTDNETASFRAVEASISQAPAEWTQVTAQLPEGTTYFAIRVHAKQKFMLMLDDVEYTLLNTEQLRLLGYNVWLEGERRNETILTATAYSEPSFGQGDYRVTAVYEQGESTLSLPMEYKDGICELQSSQADTATPIYDLSGRTVKQPGKGVYVKGNRKVILNSRK